MLFSDHDVFDDSRVLLAIEHPTSAELLNDRLERREAHIERVQNGQDALAAANEVPFDLLVAQADLPGRTGVELLRNLPYLDPPVVLLGRETNDDAIVRSYEFGAVDYITRPFAPKVAAARILRFLRLSLSANPSVLSS